MIKHSKVISRGNNYAWLQSFIKNILPVTEECLRRNNETSDSVSFTKYVRWQVRHSGSVIKSSPLVWLLLSSLQHLKLLLTAYALEIYSYSIQFEKKHLKL